MSQIIIIIGGLVLSIFCVSGYGVDMHINEKLTYIALLTAIIYSLKSNRPKLHLGNIYIALNLSCIILAINVIIHYNDSIQLTNFTSLFGILIGVNLLRLLKWETTDFLIAGILLICFSALIIYLFRPGQILSGWNKNSSILILPCALCGLSLISYSSFKYWRTLYLSGIILILTTVFELQNRSALICVALMTVALIPGINIILKKRQLFRIAYISAIALNVCMPIFQKTIGESEIYNDVMDASQEVVEKDKGFSKREERWEIALSQVEDSPLVGNGGTKGSLYFHNFSCDVLVQFGWIGWITVAIMYVILMEKCFKSNSRGNVFLFAFICILIMDCYENSLFANNYYLIFPYLLFAIPYRLNKRLPRYF